VSVKLNAMVQLQVQLELELQVPGVKSSM